MSYSSEVLADSPAAYWKFDEVGANAVDATGGDPWLFGIGVVAGGTALVADGGKSVHGDGANPICTYPAVPSALSGANVTLEAWVSLPGTNVKGSFVKVGSSANGWGMGIGGTQWDNAGQKLILLSEAVAWHPTTYTFPGAGTYHVMVVRGAGGAVTAYVNGASVWTGTLTSPIAASGQMGVGGYTEPYGFKLSSSIQVDNVALYASALSSARVTAHYNSGSGSNSAVAADAPTVWLKLDDANTTTSTAADSSGNGRSLTHFNAPSLGLPSLLGDGSGVCVGYTATNQYSSIPTASWMASPTGLTVEARIRPAAAVLSAGGFIASRWGGGADTNHWLFGVTNTGKLTASVSLGGVTVAVTGATTLTADTPYTVALRWTPGGNLVVFLNGVSDGSVAAPGAIGNPNTQIDVARAALTGGSGLSWLGRIDELSVTAASLSDARLTTRHAAAVAAAGAITGAMSASAPAPSVSVAGVVARTGVVSATAPPPAMAVSGSAFSLIAGTVQATPSSPSVVVSGDVSGIASGFVTATAAAPSLAVDGGVIAPTTGEVAAVASSPTLRISDAPGLAPAEFETDSALDVAPLADMAGLLDVAEFTATGSLDAGALHSIDIVPDVTTGGDSWLRVIDELAVALDPVTGRPQYKLIAVDKFGTPIAELDTAVMGAATRSLNGRGGFEFTLGKADPKLPYVPQYAEVQLWRGRHMVPGGWFVITDPAIGEGADSFDHQCAGLYWYFEGRLVGKERPELLRNGGFEQGMRYWAPGYSPGSNAETPPKWEITDEACEGGKALRVFADDKVVEFKRTVETQGVFVANSSTFLSGGEQFIRDAIADIPKKQSITIEGHTADADGGTGYALSVARANAARSIALAARPDLTVTAVGMGETQQVASNATEAGRRKNRRVVIRANFTSTKVGHRQFVGQSFIYTNDTDEPLEFDIQCQARIDTWGGPSKDGWILYADVRPVGQPKKILNNGSVNVDEFTVRNRWMPLHTTVTVPANSTAQVNVRGYPTAGATSFDQFSAMPNLKLTFNQKDPQQVITGLVEHAQDPAFGKSDLNIQTFGNWSGFKIDRPYAWAQHTRISDAIDEVVRSLNGPDANMLVTARRRWLVCAPKQGHETGIVLAAGDRIGDARILGYESGVDGDTVATTAIVQSSWSGGGMSEVFARKARTDGLVLERLYQAEQDAPVSTLTEQAGTAVEYGRAGLITRVRMHPDYTTYLMSHVTIGDVVTVDVHDSQVQVRADHRIIQIDLDPNLDQLTYTLAPKE